MQDFVLESIRDCPMFSGLPDADIKELIERSRRLSVGAGECLMSEGEIGDSLFVILDGEVEVVRDTGDSEAMLARFGAGAFVGEMALIDEGPRSATVRTITPATVLVIERDEFDHLLENSPGAARGLVRTVLRRLKSTEAMLVNQEKMAALGRVSAGIAHELNNPASAIHRSAEQMQSLIEEWQTSTIAVGQLPGSPAVDRCVSRLRTELAAEISPPSRRMSALERADLEAEIEDWLDRRNVEHPWDHAGNLAAAGWTIDQLDEVCREAGEANIPTLMAWLSHGSAIQTTLAEMRSSASRLSSIVDSVKRYSHMDRAPVEQVDINQGIDATLTMLRHKMKSIELILELDDNLPRIEGYPAELNQVWTNLIDNAIDAMHGKGQLRIVTHMIDDCVAAELTDSGGGIAPEHVSRLFEPFFTTKDVGVGTGLGLHISHNIVVQRHGGRIEVDSGPDGTTFTVSLPLSRANSGSNGVNDDDADNAA